MSSQPSPDASRSGRLRLLGGVVALAAVLVVAAILISSGGGDDPAPAPTTTTAAGGDAALSQQGFAVGNADTPVTLDEFADLQCPFCREFAAGALPALLQDYVAQGKLRIVFHPIAILGPDSDKAHAVAAA